MFGLSTTHMIVLVAVVVLLFGTKGKISEIMGDFGGGFKAFRRGLKDADEAADEVSKEIEHKKDL
jgi:sec-independent protein translocase protein TatA